jgi:hypothetical protein
LWNQRDISRLDCEKIVVPELAASNRFAIVSAAEFYVDTVCGITLRSDVMLSLKYLLGVLNSRLVEWFYKQTTVPKASGFYIYKTMFLKEIPIRTIDFDDPVDAALHGEIVTLVEQVLDQGEELPLTSASRKADLETQIGEIDEKIDALIYELYGLTEEEIEFIASSSQ